MYPCARSSCPVERDVRAIVRLGDDLAKAMRRLRRSLAACDACAETVCPLRQQFNRAVQSAIEQVTQEWENGGSLPHEP